ncbi:MAG: hypothetical protein ACI87E_003296 [Mariniblastus sp.]|jgi:hypothetical protein
MFDSINRRTCGHLARGRAGAIMPMFAILLPMMMIFAGFAINLAYMQLATTELKIATDAAAHAGGRAMSVHQTTDAAIAQARLTTEANLVAGQVLSVGAAGGTDQVQILFGKSVRSDNGYGMYEFIEVTKSDVDSGAEQATSLGVVGTLDLPMVFNSMNIGSFSPVRRSVATQVDRDISLVLDRSGSMLYFKDEQLLTDRLEELYETYDTGSESGYYVYAYWEWKKKKWKWKGWYREEDAKSKWENFNKFYSQWMEGESVSERLISYDEYQDATKFLYYRTYSDNVIYQLERWSNDNHTLGDSFSSSESAQLITDMAIYTYDWGYASGAARYSRWYYLDLGVTAFLNVLENTDQEERVSLVTFNSEATLDTELSDDYEAIRNRVTSINPYAGTAIGDGMETGLPQIIEGDTARPFAAKTIVVLTDGENNAGEDPETAVDNIVAQHAVTIHTVTFSFGADKEAMEAVAEAGHGRHYHADEGEALVEIFEEIANNLPTILTE